jgi:hypothetical protein
MKRFFPLLAVMVLAGLGCPKHGRPDMGTPPDSDPLPTPDAGPSPTPDAGPSPTTDAGTPSNVPPEVIEEFERHHRAWRSVVDSPEQRLISDTHRLTDHREYQAIVAMGKKALPLVIAKLAEGDFLMVRAAKQITRVNVFKASGKTLQPGELFGEQDEARLWVEWWQKNQNRPEWQP